MLIIQRHEEVTTDGNYFHMALAQPAEIKLCKPFLTAGNSAHCDDMGKSRREKLSCLDGAFKGAYRLPVR